MREVCFVNKGDNINKICFKLGIKEKIKVNSNLLFDSNYCVIKDGSEDVQIVKNYNPYLITDVQTKNILTEKGYNIIGICGDRVVFNKPSGIKYCVKPLETLEEISIKFNIDIETIIKTNRLTTNRLFVGQVLYL